MRVVIQRVKEASVLIDKGLHSAIQGGLLVFVGIAQEDTAEDVQWLVKKIANMRIFSDASGLMNLSIKDIDGNLLLVSQFTLLANATKGNRPSYIKAARPEHAIPLYEKMIKDLNVALNQEIKTGVFGEAMRIELINDGPVTILLDSKTKE